MILENTKGMKKEVNVILVIKKNTKTYYVYSCDNLFLHVGLKKNNKLVPLKDEEFKFVSEIIDKMNI